MSSEDLGLITSAVDVAALAPLEPGMAAYEAEALPKRMAVLEAILKRLPPASTPSYEITVYGVVVYVAKYKMSANFTYDYEATGDALGKVVVVTRDKGNINKYKFDPLGEWPERLLRFLRDFGEAVKNRPQKKAIANEEK